MSSPGLEITFEHQIPSSVILNQRQMSGEHGGAQCGLTSLLPMSCRGRAAAFARDLHTRLRNLGTAHVDDADNTWLPRDSGVASSSHRGSSSSPRDLDTFYDFELECESPSSPVDEYDTVFSDRSPTKEHETPFYDFEAGKKLKEAAKIKIQQEQAEKNKTNGFRISTSFYTDNSPVKLQPVPRENGNSEKQLFSPITFEGCARQNSRDELDCVVRSPEQFSEIIFSDTTVDSDSDFESAKSEPSEANENNLELSNIQEPYINAIGENLLLKENEEETVTSYVNEENKCKDVEVTESTQNKTENTQEKTDAYVTTSDNIVTLTNEETNKEESVHSDEISENQQFSLADKDESPDAEEEEDDKPQRVRRCSSLKTGKTPPGTPGRKKIVRFADVLGLDLADVKTFMDDIPVIPKSAFNDLTGCDAASSPPVRAPQRFGALTLVPLFQVPRNVTEKLENLCVCLESAKVGDGVHINVCGTVLVRNLDFHKTVHIRYSMNKWRTYTDLQATYVAGSCDGYSDRFNFIVYVPCISTGQRLEIAVRFQCKGQQFWDNNSGANYCFDCLALGAIPINATTSSGPLHPTVDWHPSFY